MPKKIIVVGFPSQIQTRHQIKLLKKNGAEVILIDPYGHQGVYELLQWHNDNISWANQDISIDQIHSVLAPALAPESPQQEAFAQSPNQTLDWPSWFKAACLQRDRSDSILSLMLMYEKAGVPVYNPSSASMISRRKPYQLSVFRNIGCPIPETLITNDFTAAQSFIHQHEDIILKPTSGGALTLSPDEISEEHLKNIRHVPAIFQQRIRGGDIRVIVVDKKVISVARVNVPEDTLDFRGDQEYQQGKISYDEITLPKDIQQYCEMIPSRLGLRIGGIDIKQTVDNQFYFLECNSSPIYLDVERKLKHPITQHICDALLK